jgi:HSP20 family protein
MSDKTSGRSPDRSDTWADFVSGRWLDWLDLPQITAMRRGEHVLHVEEFRENRDLVIRAEMPGIDPEKDVDIQLRDHVLEIRAERSQREDHERTGGYRSEFRYGRFFRAVPLPTNAKESDVKAGYHDGILEVRVPVEPDTGAPATRIPVER